MEKIFVCHASEDKEAVARPLAEALLEKGYGVWYDDFSLSLGDRLHDQIDAGLRDCDFGVVVLSQAFFAKPWTQRELDGLAAKESTGSKVILPVWHEVDRDFVAGRSLMLSERIAAKTSDGVDEVVQRIENAINKGGMHRSRQQGSSLTPFLIKIRISGAGVCQSIAQALWEQTHIPQSSMKEVVVKIYEDASGIDRDESYVRFKSGARWFPDLDVVLLCAAGLVPELPPGYVALGWSIPESSFYSKESLELSDHDVEVLFGRELAVVQDETELSYLESLLKCDYQYLDDVLWGASSVGRGLIRRFFKQGKLTVVEDLLKKHFHSESRWSFVLAVAIVEEMVGAPVEMANPLAALLVAEASPLNDHWKTVLKSRMGIA